MTPRLTFRVPRPGEPFTPFVGEGSQRPSVFQGDLYCYPGFLLNYRGKDRRLLNRRAQDVLTIFYRATRYRQPFPSEKELASQLGLSERTIQRYVHVLREEGLLHGQWPDYELLWHPAMEASLKNNRMLLVRADGTVDSTSQAAMATRPEETKLKLVDPIEEQARRLPDNLNWCKARSLAEIERVFAELCPDAEAAERLADAMLRQEKFTGIEQIRKVWTEISAPLHTPDSPNALCLCGGASYGLYGEGSETRFCPGCPTGRESARRQNWPDDLIPLVRQKIAWAQANER